jgi:hypothetical protein
MTLELTNDEANALAQLLDLAVKAGGLGAAEAALPIFNKLKKAAEPSQENEE